MNLRELQPADVVKSSWLEEYGRKMNLLWQELILLNSKLYVLERLCEFPLRLFKDAIRGNLPDIVAANPSTMCAMSMWRLWLDKDRRSLTLKRFSQDVTELLQPKYRQEFKRALGNLKLDEPAMERVQRVRHRLIAHFDSKCNLSPQERRKIRLLLADLAKLRDTLYSVFEILCFGLGRAVLPPYCEPKVQRPRDMDPRSDLEAMLDEIARNSPMLNMPEEQSQGWSVFRKDLLNDDRQAFNEYQRRVGLPEA